MVDEQVTSLILRWLAPGTGRGKGAVRSWAMATINGAEAWEKRICTEACEEGQKADLILVDPNLNADMLPIHDPIANLVTSMHSTNIHPHHVGTNSWNKHLLTWTSSHNESQTGTPRAICRGGISLPTACPCCRNAEKPGNRSGIFCNCLFTWKLCPCYNSRVAK